MRRARFLAAITTAAFLAGGTLLLASGPLGLAPALAGASCAQAGTTGLTAKVVATGGEHITGRVDATGCDVGVYVGPGVTGVVISGATITGANDHAIFIEDTTRVVVEQSTITHNGLAPAKGVGEAKAVALVGTRGVIVRDNLVTGNLHGGIEVNDDGSLDPGAPNPGTPSPAVGNTISRNRVIGNVGDCGIVIAAYNPGQGVARNIVADNTVADGEPGAIIVAADPPGASATDNAVLGNIVRGNLLPGIIVHSNAPNDTVTGTLVLDNTISGNGPDPEAAGKAGPTKPTGILVVGEVAPVTGTDLVDNRISDEYWGIWESNTSGTLQVLGGFDHATAPVYP